MAVFAKEIDVCDESVRDDYYVGLDATLKRRRYSRVTNNRDSLSLRLC
jgi:hypothetical protein